MAMHVDDVPADPVSSVITTSPQGLILYAFYHKSAHDSLMAEGVLRLPKHGKAAGHIGLRTSLQEALNREKIFSEHINKHTHNVLEVRFTPLGLAHYTTISLGASVDFRLTLYKNVYWRYLNEFGVWHFFDDMPLCCYDQNGNLLIQTTWHFIE